MSKAAGFGEAYSKSTTIICLWRTRKKDDQKSQSHCEKVGEKSEPGGGQALPQLPCLSEVCCRTGHRCDKRRGVHQLGYLLATSCSSPICFGTRPGRALCEFFFLMMRGPPRSTRVPYTTPFSPTF